MLRPALLLALACASWAHGALAGAATAAADWRIESYREGVAQLRIEGSQLALHVLERAGRWTLVAAGEGAGDGPGAYAVLEDFTRIDGRLRVLDAHGLVLDLAKAAEPTRVDPKGLYLGHAREEVAASPSDLLAREVLAMPGDPTWERVAGAFEPIRRIPTYGFVGTPDTIDKVGFAYGGRSPDFDPATLVPAINSIREQGRVLDGLVGGYLPVLRFVYPESEGTWTELLAYAPFRIANGNDRLQPVWYRVARVEGGTLRWLRYVDSYQPFPPRGEPDAAGFYADLRLLRSGWDELLSQAMRIDLPDAHFADMARFALVRDLMTRVAGFPKYGAVDKDYAGSEHDGFPDTFTVDLEALVAWGLLDRAGDLIDNYLGQFVRDDGSLMYRGPEIGQYGRMLTELADYATHGGDAARLLRWRTRIDGITNLLLGLRQQALALPPGSAAYGMIAGWSEADACLDADPQRYMQPYFSNSAEAARGFLELGRTWARLGARLGDGELRAWGERLQHEGEALAADLHRSIARSMLVVDGERILPSIAGVREPFHVVVPRDPLDPQYRSYRAYMEMLHSGLLTREEARAVVDYRGNHHDLLMGMPSSYGHATGAVAGFLSYGHGYGLIQHDAIREALLLAYANMAHGYTRGTWLAPETRSLLGDGNAAPYATPAQLVAALMTRWLLVFEDPQSGELWIGKGIPAAWLADGLVTRVAGAPTARGRIGFELRSHLAAGRIEADLDLPPPGDAPVRLRLRAPGDARLAAVSLDGHAWRDFDAATGTIRLPASLAGHVAISARFRPTGH